MESTARCADRRLLAAGRVGMVWCMIEAMTFEGRSSRLLPTAAL
jgi:hypothetical protein